jgi:RNA polymerase sigma-70 factor (ECF subfamily)
VTEALERAFREERAAVLATLIRKVGDFDLAEEALQDAFTAAASAWRDGVPANPGAWLTVAAQRRAVDRVRRGRAQAARAERLAREPRPEPRADDGFPDDRLRLIFTCCHPALNVDARVALTLRALGGLTTAEIARAFLVAEPTMGKRIVRAKRKIAEAHIPYEVPQDLAARLGGVLAVLYLIFNEGYEASSGDALARAELCEEAIRLARLLCELLPDEAEARGLLALMLLTDARRGARVDADGRYVALDEQDRSAWDGERIAAGLRELTHALRPATAPGRYTLQAAIAAAHLRSDWDEVAALYRALEAIHPSPVVTVNRAAAVGLADSPGEGLALLEPLLRSGELRDYQPLHATHAELLRRAGDAGGAARAYRRAIRLTDNAVERSELQRRIETLS